jgi:hypothetical protein
VKIHWGNLLIGFLLGAMVGGAVLGKIGLGGRATSMQ